VSVPSVKPQRTSTHCVIFFSSLSRPFDTEVHLILICHVKPSNVWRQNTSCLRESGEQTSEPLKSSQEPGHGNPAGNPAWKPNLGSIQGPEVYSYFG
jgi:hypothetical protein